MIEFIELNNSAPYNLFLDKYNSALLNDEPNIEAVSISSFNKDSNEVHARIVNLKYINNTDWIFFSNYNSQKSKDFKNHNQITAIFFWKSIKTQVILKAKIRKTDKKFSDTHFLKRSRDKNALAISSNQSNIIDSYQNVQRNYNKIFNTKKILKRPKYWGGFSFVPYYFEFWEGHDSRINRRKVFKSTDNSWQEYLLEP